MRQKEIINSVPQQPQRQDGLRDQLETVAAMANRIGCYDAADYLLDLMQSGRMLSSMRDLKAELGDDRSVTDVKKG